MTFRVHLQALGSPRHSQARRQSRRAKTTVLTSTEQPAIAQQMHIPEEVLADIDLRGLPHRRRLGPVAEQDADRRSERLQVGGIGRQNAGTLGDLVDETRAGTPRNPESSRPVRITTAVKVQGTPHSRRLAIMGRLHRASSPSVTAGQPPPVQMPGQRTRKDVLDPRLRLPCLAAIRECGSVAGAPARPGRPCPLRARAENPPRIVTVFHGQRSSNPQVSTSVQGPGGSQRFAPARRPSRRAGSSGPR